MEKTLKIEGMMCGHCEARREKGPGGSSRSGKRRCEP